MKRWKYAVTTLLIVLLAGFVLWTWPTNQTSNPARLTVEWLPVNQWGVGTLFRDGADTSEEWHKYGVIVVKRTYYSRP